MANISFLVDWFPGGGVERVIMNLAQPLSERGHRVFLFVHNLHTEKLAKELPIEYIVLPHTALSSRNREFVEQAIKQHHIDIFFAPGRFPSYLPKLRKEGLCKLVYVLHGCPFYEKLEKWGSIIRPKKGTLKEWLSRWLIDYPKYKLGYYDRKTTKRYRRIYGAVDAYGVLFEEYGRMVAEKVGVSYEESKCVVLQNPIELNTVPDLTAKREKRVLYVGRLSYWDKRIDRLLAVWERVYERFPEWRLEIVGEGSERANLERIVGERGLQRVAFTGFECTPERLYASSEILCLTSTIEGCPMVLLEAQLCETATISFDCSPGVRRLLSPNWESGVYLPAGDIEAYAEALARLMSDEKLRRSIQKRGAESARHFSPENSAAQYDALIDKLMQK
ncbi:MAG: glycosyltransferase [Alistipes sp.]|nr:glycosyltransferase [Alistipes sp.]